MGLLLIWFAAGLRRVADGEFGVLEGFGRVYRVSGPIVLAPPGLFDLSVYALGDVELPLPTARHAMLPADDGRRFGLRGWITVRPEPDRWRALHAAAGEGGVAGALIAATREAGPGLEPALRMASIPAALAREFEQALGASLAKRGLALSRLALDSIDFLGSEGGEAPVPPSTRLLLIGLDGADWAILDPLIEQGRLPNLARLIDDGVRARLLSISPMLSPVIWTSVATGVPPSRHGILDFLVEQSGGGSRQPVTSVQRKVPTVWEMLSGAEIPVGVVGWWASWPADPVRGYLVSDRLAYQLFGYRADPDDAEGKTWPPDLYESIRGSIVDPADVHWETVVPYLAGSRLRPEQFDADERDLLDQFRTLLASAETHIGIALDLERRLDPRFEALYLEGTDTVGHLFMPYRPPSLPGVDEARSTSFGQIVDRYYETADRQLGRMLEGRDESWTVMILSDHGFATDTTRPRSTDARIGHGVAADWHRRFGMLVLSGRHVRRGVRLEEAGIYDIAPTILALFGRPVPRSWPGHVLAGALQSAFLERHPVRVAPFDPERGAVETRRADPAAADLLRKLQSLGYVSGASGSDSVSATNNAGVALLGEGRYAEAEAEFRKGLEQRPGAPLLTLNLGLALLFQGSEDEARSRFEAAREFPTTWRVATHQLARLRLRSGDLTGAEQLVGEILAAEPSASEAHDTLALIHETRGDLDAAEGHYRRAAALDPDAANPRNNLGTLARSRGDLGGAEDWYLRAIEADPYFLGSYNNLALVYQARGEVDRAVDLYRRALGKAPGNAIVLNNLASLFHARGERAEARRLWRESMESDPDYVSPINNLAALEIEDGSLEAAKRLLDRAIGIDPGYGDARLNRAMIFLATERVDRAREDLRQATSDPATGARSWLQLGRLELGRGDAADALVPLEQARLRAPDDTGVLNALGEAYLRVGRDADANAVWKRSLELDPEQPMLRRIVESRAEGRPGSSDPRD